MATNDNKSDSTDQSASSENSDSDNTEEQDLGLSAAELADRVYDPNDVWNHYKGQLLGFLVILGVCIAAFMFYDESKKGGVSERNTDFLKAAMEEDGAEERLLSFAADHEDRLGGIAAYRAGVIQYRDKRYDESTKSFEKAVGLLQEDPILGRALLGQAVSRIRNDERGVELLKAISVNQALLPADRDEAHFLLGVFSLSQGDEEAFSAKLDLLGEDLNASYYHSRLEELGKTQELFSQSQSLSDLNAENGKSFLSQNAQRKDVVSLESGLQYEIIQKGAGVSPLAEDEVEVHYHGTLTNGEVFDSSIERDEPSKFQVKGVIKGWTEALQLMKVGGKWKVFIPSDLAYAENGNNSIGPNETLIFEVELLGITPKTITPELVDSNATDSNSSSAEAPLIIPQREGNATLPGPAVESNASTSPVPVQPVDGNGSQ